MNVCLLGEPAEMNDYVASFLREPLPDGWVSPVDFFYLRGDVFNAMFDDVVVLPSYREIADEPAVVDWMYHTFWQRFHPAEYELAAAKVAAALG